MQVYVHNVGLLRGRSQLLTFTYFTKHSLLMGWVNSLCHQLFHVDVVLIIDTIVSVNNGQYQTMTMLT